MRHPFFSSARPRIFAHRGGSALAPENTIAAFDRALALHADGLEFDVRLTRDGLLAVHHDRTLERTTNDAGAIARRTSEELARVDAAYRFAPEEGFPLRGCGIGVPTLGEVLNRYPGVPIIIELKEHTSQAARAVAKEVRACQAIEWVCVGSFSSRVLKVLRALDPEIATSAGREETRWALYRSWCGVPLPRRRYDGFQVPEMAGRTRVVSPRFVEAARRAGLGVQVWTVDSEADALRLLNWGADALITNRPDRLAPLVANASGRS